jgi:FAD/FMN-containing dehydrogenase
MVSTTDIQSALSGIVGDANVLAGEATRSYTWDALGSGRGYRGFDALVPDPIAVVRAASTEEVARIVGLAGSERVPLVPLGGGSGLMGGALPAQPSIVVDLTRMDRILSIDGESMRLHVQAGAVLRSVNDALEPQGLSASRPSVGLSPLIRSATGASVTVQWETKHSAFQL